MKLKQILTYIIIFTFLLALINLGPLFNQHADQIGEPTLFHAKYSSLVIENTTSYSGANFTGTTQIRLYADVTFNESCKFYDYLSIYDNSTSFFENSSFQLYSLNISERARSTFQSCTFSISGGVSFALNINTENVTVFEGCTFNSITGSGIDFPLDIYGSGTVYFIDCDINTDAIQIKGNAQVEFNETSSVIITSGGNGTALRMDENAVLTSVNSSASTDFSMDIGNKAIKVQGNATLSLTDAVIEGDVEDYSGGGHGDGSSLDVTANGHVYLNQCTLNIYDTWFHNGTVVLTRSTLNLTETPYPSAAHHFEVLDRCQVTIDATTILAPSSMFEVSGKNATIRIWNDSEISFGLRSEIDNNSAMIIEDSTVHGDLGVLYNASLTLKNATINGAIVNLRDAPCVTIQDNLTVVDIMTEVLWVKTDKGITIINNTITSNHTDYTAWEFISSSNFTINKRQYLVIARSGADILINSSQIYGLIATHDAQATLDNTTITAILIPANEATLTLTNCTILGEGNLAAQHGSVQSYSKAYFSGDSNWNSSTSFLDCTIHGKIFMFTGTNPGTTIVSQRSTYDVDVFDYLETKADGEVLVLDRQGVHLTVTAWESGDLMTTATVDVNHASVPTVTNETLHFELDPVTHQIPGQATFGIIASNGSGSVTRNFTVTIPSDGIRKATFWNTTSDFEQYADNNATLGIDQLTLARDGIEFDFTDDENGADPAGWVVVETDYPNSETSVIAELPNHSKVVKMFDNKSGEGTYMHDTFADQSTGTIEFWIYNNGSIDGIQFLLYDVPNYCIYLFFDVLNEELTYWNGTGWTYICDITKNIWQYFQMNFTCHPSYSYNIWLDHNQMGEDIPFYRTGVIDKVLFTTGMGNNGEHQHFLDAIDYSWSDGWYRDRSYATYGETNYTNPSIWTSQITDLGAPSPYYQNLTFSCDTSDETNVFLSYRSNNSNSDLSTQAWSEGSNDSLSINGFKGRYFQVRALLNTTNITQTPVLHWINLSYRIDFNDISWNTTEEFENSEHNCTILEDTIMLQWNGVTHDFTNDTLGTDPAGWNVVETDYPNTETSVIAELPNHSKVVKMFDNKAGERTSIDDTFAAQSTGTIEFWTYNNGTVDGIQFLLYEGTAWMIYLFINVITEELLQWTGSWEKLCDVTNDAWHYLRLDFNCASDTFDVWVDHTNTNSSLPFYNPVSSDATTLNKLLYTTGGGSNGEHQHFLDAIDYSWSDGYLLDRSYTYYGENIYATEGLWTATQIDLNATSPYYKNITFTCTLEENITNVEISYRMHANSSTLNETNWTLWSNQNITINAYGDRYFQVRAKLTTENITKTPTLHTITVKIYYF